MNRVVLGTFVVLILAVSVYVIFISKEPAPAEPTQGTAADDTRIVTPPGEKTEEKPGETRAKEDAQLPKQDSQDSHAKAYEHYKTLMREGKDYEAREALAAAAGGTFLPEQHQAMVADMKAINERLIFSVQELRDAELYSVQPGDNLTKIAKKFNTEASQLLFINRMKSDRLQPGQKIKVLKGKFSVRVDKSRFLLQVLYQDTVFRDYPVGLGKDNKTPVGTFVIKLKQKNPDWYKTDEFGRKTKVEYGKPENVLGERWMGFDKEGYGIHGTTQPESIGQNASEGCVRMNNAHVIELYEIIPVGSTVTITD